MKLQAQPRIIERSGVAGETSFTIKTTAKAFDILSSGLYSDKILAIIRELSCNALDAHIEVGKGNVPFEIHMPNTLEPFFSVKDYGTGLSDEDIRGTETIIELEDGSTTIERIGGLYTTYFDSSKTNSNSFIGALGLGSKSPFSYTKAFNVTSRYNGILNVYNIFLNEDGVPTVALTSSIDTDEDNGLEVKLAVKETDRYTFSQKTKLALKYFEIHPTIKGDPNFTWLNPFPYHGFRGDNWAVTDASWGEDKLVAIQGNIAYPVDLCLLAEDSDSITGNCIKFFETNAIALYFNIGDLEVAASREKLQYNATTRANLIEHLNKVWEDYATKLYELFDVEEDENLWDVYIKFHDIAVSSFGDVRSMYKVLSLLPPTDNKVVTDFFKNKGIVDISVRGFNTITIDHYSFKSASRATTYNTNLRRITSWRGSVNPADMTIVINDVKSSGIKRTAQYLSKINKKDAIVIRYNKNHDMLYINEEINIVKEQLGNPDIKYISEITDVPERYTTSRPHQHTLPIFTFDTCRSQRNSRHGFSRHSGSNFEHIEQMGGLYIQLKGGTTPFDHNHEPLISLFGTAYEIELQAMLDVIRFHTGDSSIQLYGFTNRPLKKIQRSSNWLSLTNEFKRVINLNIYKTMFNMVDVKRNLKFPCELTCRDVFNSNVQLKHICASIKDIVGDSSPFADIWDHAHMMDTNYVNDIPISLSMLTLLKKYIDWDIKPIDTHKDIKLNTQMYLDIVKRYPLISLFQTHLARGLLNSDNYMELKYWFETGNVNTSENYSDTTTVYRLLEYIKLVDSQYNTTKEGD